MVALYSDTLELNGQRMTKDIYVMIEGHTDTDKLIVNRKLASGATFEATYVDTAAGDSLDLELAVKF